MMLLLRCFTLILFFSPCCCMLGSAPLISFSVPFFLATALGGATTIDDASPNAFSFPAPNLSPERKRSFFVGNSFFKQNWVIAPSSTAARDGLGPQFNARSCSACHFKDGRGAPPNTGEDPVALLFRLSIPGQINPHEGVRPEPTYGTQLQNLAIPGYKPKGKPVIIYEEIEGQFPDGEHYQLRKPTYSFDHLSEGPLHPETLIGPRIAPQIIGMGLLEAIPEQAILALADPTDTNSDGISGKPNYVWDVPSQSYRIGRFGWKANAPSVLQQTAAAFNGDIGITSSLFKEDSWTQKTPSSTDSSTGALASKPPHTPEIPDPILAHVALYTQALAVPAQRNTDKPQVQHGRILFEKIGCASCHNPQFTTGTHPDFPEFENQTILPYTDLLLHDMGDGLADNRPDFDASGSEWRTPPLWGIGLIETVNNHTNYLHDGRARNLQEAILWHGGEAESSKNRYLQLPRQDREAVLRFLESL